MYICAQQRVSNMAWMMRTTATYVHVQACHRGAVTALLSLNGVTLQACMAIWESACSFYLSRRRTPAWTSLGIAESPSIARRLGAPRDSQWTAALLTTTVGKTHPVRGLEQTRLRRRSSHNSCTCDGP